MEKFKGTKGEAMVFKKPEKEQNKESGRNLIEKYSSLFERLEKLISQENNTNLSNQLLKLKNDFKENIISKSILSEKLEEMYKEIISNEYKTLEEAVEEVNKKEFKDTTKESQE